jgi:predicted deacylase
MFWAERKSPTTPASPPTRIASPTGRRWTPSSTASSAARAGFASANLRAEFPRLITCDISGYGEDGPFRDMKAYDLLVQAESGLANITGSPNEPGRVGVSVCDIACGMYAHQAILQALFARERTGKNRGIQVSLYGAMADWMNVPYLQHHYGGKTPGRPGLNHPTIAPYGAYQCGDGKPLLISIQNEREWRSLCANVLGGAEIADDPRFATNPDRVANRPALDAIIHGVFGGAARGNHREAGDREGRLRPPVEPRRSGRTPAEPFHRGKNQRRRGQGPGSSPHRSRRAGKLWPGPRAGRARRGGACGVRRLTRALAYFSNDYRSARSRFLVACKMARLRVESIENPDAERGGEPVYTDVAVLGPENTRAALMLTSGTHGVEGFCGSAIQTGLILEGLAGRMPPDLRIVMVHAVNPYGFAHLRRVNEDNIDLNRNFIDHGAAPPTNPAYDELAGLIAPTAYWQLATGATLAQLLIHRAVRGTAILQAAITGGQYSHPRGLFYGGQAPAWSNKTFRQIVRRRIVGAERAALLDIHTGLGLHNKGEIISGEMPGSPAHARTLNWWGDRVKSSKAGESVSVDLSGTIESAFREMLPRAEVTAVTLEFGTFPAIQMLHAMQAENWLHHHGGGSRRRATKIKSAMRHAFYPDSDSWKLKVWNQANEVVEQALRGLSS